MKRTILVLLLTLSALTAAYLTGHSQQSAPGDAPRHTRVGVVDIGRLYQDYHRVKRYKDQIDHDMAPIQQTKDRLEASLKEWTAIAVSKDECYSPETKEMAGRIVVESKRQLEDLADEVKSVMGGKVEKILTKVNEDISKAVEKFASCNGYHLVLYYGEPAAGLADGIALMRKMAVVDKSGLILLHAHKEVDITNPVLHMLNNPKPED